MTWLALILVAISAWVAWKIETRRRQREAELEQQRRWQVGAFATALQYVLPHPLPPKYLDVSASFNAKWSSHTVANELLDFLDNVEGSVVGTHAPPQRIAGSPGWPFVADEHRARGHASEWTVTPLGIPLILPTSLRDRHVYAVGKTGSGKTTQLRNLILQDITAGRGVAVIVREQEFLTEELLPFLPEDRLDDVIIVDPGDARPVPLNPFHVTTGEGLDRKIDETLTILLRLFASDGSAPRTEMILRQSVATLMTIPGATLLDLPRLIDPAEDAYRRSIAAALPDAELRRFWLQTYPAFPKDAHLPLVNRLGRVLQPKVVRRMLCQPGCLDVRATMDSGKILFVVLSDGLLGPLNAALIGQFLIAKIQLAAMSRADTPKDQRQPFYLYLDEFQSLGGLESGSYEAMLSRARKYGVCVTLAHQQTAQLPDSLLKEILGNVGSMMVFNAGATDARRLSRELGVQPDELLALGQGEAYCKFDRQVVRAQMLPPPQGGRKAVRDEAVRRSRRRYGLAPGTRPGTTRPLDLGDLDPGEVF